MDTFDPRMQWLCICIRALMKTHPDPALLRATWHEMAEMQIAQRLARSRDEQGLEAMQEIRGGYEDWLPPEPTARE